MPTTSSGNVTPGTGKITYPDNTSTVPGSQTSSSSGSSTPSATSTPVRINALNIPSDTGVGVLRDLTHFSPTDVLFNFRSLVAGAGISLTANTTSITISSTSTSAIPTRLSQLTNDVNFISSLPIASSTTLGAIKVGSGLTINQSGVLSTTGNALPSFSVNKVTSNYQVTPNDYTILVDASASPVIITLPAASIGTSVFNVKKIDASTNAVTIVVSGSDHIDLVSSFTLNFQLQAIQVQSDGSSHWWIF